MLPLTSEMLMRHSKIILALYPVMSSYHATTTVVIDDDDECESPEN